MTRWEAEFRTIEVLPPRDRAKVVRQRNLINAAVKITYTLASIGAGAGATTLIRWLAS